MNIFKWFASGPDAASKVLDAGISGVDKIFFTKEEQSEARQKLLDSWIKLQESLGPETTVRAVARRIIALLFVVPFVLMVVAAAIIHPFNAQYAVFLIDVAQGQFGWIVLTVVGFYFGPYMISKAIGKGKE